MDLRERLNNSSSHPRRKYLASFFHIIPFRYTDLGPTYPNQSHTSVLHQLRIAGEHRSIGQHGGLDSSLQLMIC